MNIKEELNKFYKEFVEPNLPKTKKDWVILIIVVLAIVSLGTFGLNQYIELTYKTTLIQNPCALCEEFMLYNRAGVIPVNLSENLQNYTPTT